MDENCERREIQGFSRDSKDKPVKTYERLKYLSVFRSDMVKKLVFPETDRFYKSFIEEDLYKEEERLLLPRPRIEKEEYEKEPEKRPREISVERRTIHKMLSEEQLEPLRTIGPKVIGNLFDRVEFLKQRMAETQAAIETRKKLHNDIIQEVDADIDDKQKVLEKLSDIDDIRDFKLDISSLRMEKRRENVLFWRDIFDLSTQLRESIEEYQMENKIANLFEELKPGG